MSGPLTAPTTTAWLTAMIPAVFLLALHYLWVLRSDAAFEEVAAQASLKRSLASRPRRSVRRDPPPYRLTPRGSQAGAILWKNLVGVWRTGRPRVVALGLMVAGVLVAVLSFRTGSTLAEIVGWFAVMWAGFLLVIGPQWVRSDLRSDMPSLDLLRSYPLPGGSVIAGEVAASTLVVSALQLGVLTIAYLAFLGNRVMEPGLPLRTAALAAGFVLLPVINLLGVLIHNAAVILYPAWLGLAAGRPAGIEALGQNMLAIVAYLILLACVLALPAAVGALVFFALEPSTGWLPAVALAAIPALAVAGTEARLMIGWIGRAFERTDPSTAGITS
jgi:hypothetical protein